MPVIAVDTVDFGDPTALPHDSLADDVIICAVLCFVIAAVSVGLRFYTRVKIVRTALGASDWVLLASLIVSGLHSAFFIKEALEGLGSHVWDFDVEANYSRLQQTAWLTILWYNVLIPLIKVSFLLLYIKLFTYQKAEVICKIILGIAIVTGIYGVLLSLTACIPLRAFWDKGVTDAYCHGNDVWWVNTAAHVVTDFLIWSVPLPQIWRSKMPKQQKVTLLCLFSLGFTVALISIIRIGYLDDLQKKADPDFAWVGARFAFLSLIEVNAAITVACLMTLKPLINQLFPKFLRADSLRELPGNTPPTIGSMVTPRDAHDGHRNRAPDKAGIEEWEMVRADLDGRTTGSVSAS